MKTAIVLTVGSFISMILISVGVYAMFLQNPAAFGVQPAPEQAPNDTTAVVVKEKVPDSTAGAVIPVQTKTAVPQKQTAAPVKSLTAEVPVPVRDTTDWKSRAKLFEAMNIEAASSILQTMNDKDVKQIIPHIKKRSAAKILASFDPDRAARIIR